jgi:hypothetical protein
MAAKEIPQLTDADKARFEGKINKDGPVPAHRSELAACWIWTGQLSQSGYGRFWFSVGKFGAHSVALFVQTGIQPNGLLTCHKCDNPACVRPSHLFLGTSADNTHDMLSKSRDSRGEHHSAILLRVAARGDDNGSRTRPERLKRGETHHRAELTASDVMTIRSRYAAGGVKQKELALEFGVSRPHISYLVSGKKWRHLNETAAPVS